jgi:hypothetical protein
MKKSLAVVTLVLALGGCATRAPLMGVSSAPYPGSTPAASATSRSPSSTNPTPASPTPTSTGSFDTLPAGYSYAYLYRLTQVSGRWSVVLDPVTMCMYPSTDTNCSDITEPPPNDYEIRNINPRTYTVPLAAGTVLSVVGPSGEQTPLVTVPMAEKTWSTSSTGPQIIVTYSTNPAGEVSVINEWWHP